MLWIQAFHIIAVLFWMAALFYLPRLFVYHAESPEGSARAEMLALMERRLLKAIATPSMIAAWLFGLMLLWDAGWALMGSLWFVMKLILVVGLSAFHGLCGKWRKDLLLEGRGGRAARFYRVVNEAAPVMAALVVLLAVLKPFL